MNIFGSRLCDKPPSVDRERQNNFSKKIEKGKQNWKNNTVKCNIGYSWYLFLKMLIQYLGQSTAPGMANLWMENRWQWMISMRQICLLEILMCRTRDECAWWMFWFFVRGTEKYIYSSNRGKKAFRLRFECVGVDALCSELFSKRNEGTKSFKTKRS